MSHVISNQKILKKEFILYCSKKMHKLDTFWKLAQVKTSPLKSARAKDLVYVIFTQQWSGGICVG